MKELEYPFKGELLIKKKRSLKRQLLVEASDESILEKKIAILGGETTQDIKLMLKLFLLNYGICL